MWKIKYVTCSKAFLAACSLLAVCCVGLLLFLALDGGDALFGHKRSSLAIGRPFVDWPMIAQNDSRIWTNRTNLTVLEPNVNCIVKMPKWSDSTSSRRVMSQPEWLKMMSLMEIIDMVFLSNSISYLLFGGALYGSYMSHDILPWDDDIDIMVRHIDRHRMATALLSLSPEYKLANHTSKRYMKLFFSSTPKTWGRRYEWAWPFIDIAFFDDNSTHVWESHHESDASRIYPKDMVFPLHPRPLGYLWLPAPRDTRAFLMKSIRGQDKRFRCGKQGWQHKRETAFHTKYVPCKQLLNDYAAVYRSRASGGVMETLICGNETLHSCFIQEPELAVTKGPFTFDIY